jgi:hypothetical protein
MCSSLGLSSLRRANDSNPSLQEQAGKWLTRAKSSATGRQGTHFGLVIVDDTCADVLAAGDLPSGPEGCNDLLDFRKFGIANFCIMLVIIEPCEFFMATVLTGAADLETSMGLKVICPGETVLPPDEMP